MNGLMQFLRGVHAEDAPAAVRYMDFIALFLFLLVVLIVVVAGLFVCLALHHARARKLLRQLAQADAERSEEFALARSHHPLFDSPCRWLAVRCDEPVAVQGMLDLHNATPCSWQDGLAAQSEGHNLFISPVVAGWVLVFGSGIPDPAEDIDEFYRLVLALSDEFGEVQGFAVNRVLSHHAWARVINGQVLRAYAWAGQTLWDQGQLTRAEQSLALKCHSYTDAPERNLFGLSDAYRQNSEKVFLLASKWSLDPTMLDSRVIADGMGIAGRLPSSRLH